jgi:hypothetical protein
MMPQVANVRVRTERRKTIRLWIPLLPVLLLLSPFVVLFLVVLVIASLTTRGNPVRALWTGWRLLWSLRGTRIEIEQGKTGVLVNLR